MLVIMEFVTTMEILQGPGISSCRRPDQKTQFNPNNQASQVSIKKLKFQPITENQHQYV